MRSCVPGIRSVMKRSRDRWVGRKACMKDEKWIYEFCLKAERKRYVERFRLKSGGMLYES